MARRGGDFDDFWAGKVEAEYFVAGYVFIDGVDRLRIAPKFLSGLEPNATVARRAYEIAALETQLDAPDLSGRRTGVQRMGGGYCE